MAPDDAVDLLTELDQERRLPILTGRRPPPRPNFARLLSYHPETAGGLMNPDFISVPACATVGEALEAVKASTAPPEAAGVVFVMGDDGTLRVRPYWSTCCGPTRRPRVAVATRRDPATLSPDADIHEVVKDNDRLQPGGGARCSTTTGRCWAR